MNGQTAEKTERRRESVFKKFLTMIIKVQQMHAIAQNLLVIVTKFWPYQMLSHKSF